MTPRRRWAAFVSFALLLAAAPGHVADRARQAFGQGDYAGAVSALRHSDASRPLDFDQHLLLAEANERAEGRYDVTRSALDAASQEIDSGDAGASRGALLAALRARLLSREGRSEDAAKTVLEGMAAARQAGAAGKDEFYALAEAYGIVLLGMGLGDEALRTLAEVAEARIALLPNGDPRLLMSLFWLGRAELSTGKLAEARDTLQEVVRIRTLALGPAHPDTLQARSLLALAKARSGDSGSIRERRAVLDAWLQRADQKDARAVSALLDVAEDESGTDAPAALERLRTAYKRATASSTPIERLIAEAGVRLAKALYALGRYGEALEMIADASARSPQIRDTPLAYDLDVTRAVLYRELNRPADAEPIYRALIATYDRDATLGRGNRLTLLNNLAEVQAAQGRFADATQTQRTVVAERTRLLGATAPLTLSARSALAAYLSNGGSAGQQEAMAVHRTVLAAREALSPPDEGAVAASLHNLGTSLDQAGAFPEAQKFVTRAVAIRMRLLGADHPDTIASRRELAGIMMSSGDITGARDAYAALVASMERSRAKVTATAEQRRSYFSQSAQVYKLLAVLEAQSGRNSAFAYADAARSRTLLELTTSAEALSAVKDPDGVAELGAARRDLGRLTGIDTTQMTDAARVQHTAAVDAAAARVAQVEATLQARHPQLQFASAFQPIDRSHLRAAMGDGTALLDYVVLGDRVMLLWIGPGGTMGTSEFARIPGLIDTTRAYLAMLSAPALAGTAADPMADRAVFAWKDGSFRLRRIDDAIPDDAEIITDIARVRGTLSRALLSALPPEVQNAGRWIVIPDGPLAAIPFDTLETNGKPVVSNTVVSYAPSLRLLIDLNDRLAAHRTLGRADILVMGAPSFEEAPAGSPLRAWTALPGSHAEVTALASRYRLKPGKTLFTGSAATEVQLRQLDAKGALAGYKTLFFSTHAVVDLASSERNAIVLMGDGESVDSDGFVRAAEIMSLHTNADLIIVSACESGVGVWLDGEGSMGLPFALFASGGAATLLTHWSVGDQSSAAFMARFLDKMDHGANAAVALQQTKADFLAGRAGDQWTLPAYWAAFSLYGAS